MIWVEVETTRGNAGIYTIAQQTDLHHGGGKATYSESRTFGPTIGANRAIRVQDSSSFSVRITHWFIFEAHGGG